MSPTDDERTSIRDRFGNLSQGKLVRILELGRFGRFVPTSEDVETAVVHFDIRTARWIQERQWHPDQSLETDEDGSVTLSFPMPSVYIVKRWVLQWGSGAEVLEPEQLREAVRRDVLALSQIYDDGNDT